MSQLSLRVRMVVVFGVLITAVAGFMVEFFPARMAEQARAQAELRARTMTQVIASAVAPALELDDAAHASKVLAWLASSPDARFAIVLGDTGARFAVWNPGRVPARLPEAASAIEDDLLITKAAIVGRGGGRGTLHVGLSLERLIEDRDAARDTVVSAALVVLAVGLVICALLATALVRPLERLTTIARDIASGVKPPRITALAGSREVAETTHALGTMLDRLSDANRQLVAASRHAGMAEVATGVLHNVGNILTSVNVGLETLDEHAHAIPADRVRRAGELLTAGRGRRRDRARQARRKHPLRVGDHRAARARPRPADGRDRDAARPRRPHQPRGHDAERVRPDRRRPRAGRARGADRGGDRAGLSERRPSRRDADPHRRP